MIALAFAKVKFLNDIPAEHFSLEFNLDIVNNRNRQHSGPY